jgi:hypothetical protein
LNILYPIIIINTKIVKTPPHPKEYLDYSIVLSIGSISGITEAIGSVLSVIGIYVYI